MERNAFVESMSARMDNNSSWSIEKCGLLVVEFIFALLHVKLRSLDNRNTCFESYFVHNIRVLVVR